MAFPDGRDTRHATSDDDSLGMPQLITSGVIDIVAGDPPVPIIIWRVPDEDNPYGHHADGLTSCTAQLLVLYTRPGDTIVSVGDDPAVAGASGVGCRYLPVEAAHRLADLDHRRPSHAAARDRRLVARLSFFQLTVTRKTPTKGRAALLPQHDHVAGFRQPHPRKRP